MIVLRLMTRMMMMMMMMMVMIMIMMMMVMIIIIMMPLIDGTFGSWRATPSQLSGLTVCQLMKVMPCPRLSPKTYCVGSLVDTSRQQQL